MNPLTQKHMILICDNTLKQMKVPYGAFLIGEISTWEIPLKADSSDSVSIIVFLHQSSFSNIVDKRKNKPIPNLSLI
jgi:hypothetical protein